ncbi:hypothetical protein MWG46_16330 [Escherichia coli]|nr:hypothetical protein [Escherichia coli]
MKPFFPLASRPVILCLSAAPATNTALVDGPPLIRLLRYEITRPSVAVVVYFVRQLMCKPLVSVQCQLELDCHLVEQLASFEVRAQFAAAFPVVLW